jgi:hypothetical protein
MKFFSKVENYCAIGLLVCFFLPWLQIGETISISRKGYQIPNLAHDIGKGIGQFKGLLGGSENTDPQVFWYYLIYLIPVFSVITIILGIMGKNVKATGFLAAAVPIGWFIYALIKLRTDLFKIMTFGAYLTLACAIIMILAVVELIKIPGQEKQTSA